MAENNFRYLYEIQKRIKNNKMMLSEVENAINPELKRFDEEISEYLNAMQVANRIVYAILNMPPGHSITEQIKMIQDTYIKSDNNEICEKLQATIAESIEYLQKNALKDQSTSFCVISSLFQYIWCREIIESYLNFIKDLKNEDKIEYIKFLVAHPFIISYFKASLQPIFRKYNPKEKETILKDTIDSLIEYMKLLPHFFVQILKILDNPREAFFQVFFKYYIQYPYLFGCCSYEFQLCHKELLDDLINQLETYFKSDESEQFMHNLLNSKSVVLSPSKKLFEEIVYEHGDRFLITKEDSAFLSSFVEFPVSENTILYKMDQIKPPPQPFPQLPLFVDVVISLLENSKLILAEGNNSSKSAITQIVELGCPSMLKEIDNISNDLSKLTIPELCKLIEQKLDAQESIIYSKIKETVARYSSQSSLIKMYTNVAGSVIEHAKILSFLENPLVPESIECAKALAALELSHQFIASDLDMDSKLLDFYSIDLVNDTDPFIRQCKGKTEDLKFFEQELSLIDSSSTPMKISEHIIAAMGWLSEYVFSQGIEEAGADQIVPLTILGIICAKHQHLASILLVLQNQLMPFHEKTAIFTHTESFFISTFICSASFIIDQYKLKNPPKSEN